MYRFWILLTLCWLAWLSFLGGIIHQDDVTNPLVALFSLLIGYYIALVLKGLTKSMLFITMLIAVIAIAIGCIDIVWSGTNATFGARRWRGAWANPNTYGAFCVLTMIWMFSLSCKHMTRILNAPTCSSRSLILLFCVMIEGLSFAGAIGSQSRTAIWGLGIVVGLAILLSLIGLGTRTPWRAFWFCACLCAAASMTALLVAAPAIQGRNRIHSGPSIGDASISHRLNCWHAVINIGIDNPIFGSGWGYLNEIDQRKNEIGVSDARSAMLNNFSQVFAARGFPSLICMLLILALPALNLMKTKVKQTKTILCILFFLLIQAIVNDVFFSLSLAPVLWGALFYSITQVKRAHALTSPGDCR